MPMLLSLRCLAQSGSLLNRLEATANKMHSLTTVSFSSFEYFFIRSGFSFYRSFSRYAEAKTLNGRHISYTSLPSVCVCVCLCVCNPKRILLTQCFGLNVTCRGQKLKMKLFHLSFWIKIVQSYQEFILCCISHVVSGCTR